MKMILPIANRILGPGRARSPLRTVARTDCALRNLDILQTATEANPEGWQMVAGGRSGKGGNDHRKACPDERAHPAGVPDSTAVTWLNRHIGYIMRRAPSSCNKAPHVTYSTCRRSGTPAGVQDLSYAVTRRSPPPESPRRPPATLWQPFGLTAPIWLLLAALILLAPPTRAATNDLTTTLQRGLFEEEANQNLGAAIQAYQGVASQFDKDRKLAATAIFRLGECYRKQGNTNDAATQYERILREFSDQPTLVTLSRQNLAGMGAALPATAAPVVSDAAREEQKRELAIKIKLAQKRLDEEQKHVQTGIDTSDTLLPMQRELLELKRQLAALDAGLAVSVAPTAPALSDAARQEQKRLLEEEMKLAQKQLARQQALIQHAAAADDSLWPIQREILELKRQLAALDAGLPTSFAASGSTAPAASSESDEARRIQALIKDSPDLINAPDHKGETLLQSAAAKGNLAVLKLLLDSGAAVNGLQQPGLSALHYAAGNGHKAAVDLLLSKGAKADAQTENGLTPLHLAARKGYEEVAKALLAAGAPVNPLGWGSGDKEDLPYTIGTRQTPLHLAAAAGYAGLVELLLSKGADVNAEDGTDRTALSHAVEKRYEPVIRCLLAAHANPNAGRFDLPAAIAAFQGNVPALKLLLAAGADPNTNSSLGWTITDRGGHAIPPGRSTYSPLWLAVNQQQTAAAQELLHSKAKPDPSLLLDALPDVPTLKALLEGGVDPNGLPSGGVLLQPVQANNEPAVALLLAHHADVNAATSDKWTPLHSAAANTSTNITALLLKAGAAVNARSQEGKTPLFVAVEYDRLENAALLLANGADPNVKDARGVPPLYLAIGNGKREMAQLLLANKADPNAKDNTGLTPLHAAVWHDDPELAELLLANKADPNLRNNQGDTPLDWAKRPERANPPRGAGLGTPIPAAGIPARPRRAPGLQPQTITVPTPGTPTTPSQPEWKPEMMADLLRRHGALDDLPSMNLITVRRSPVGSPGILLTRTTNDWNQFTLLDLLGMQYGLLAPLPNNEGGASYAASSLFGQSSFPFPDFARVHINRPAADLKSWQDQVTDLSPLVASGDCSVNRPVAWGDVVMIPEADHPLNERWRGFTQTELANLKACLTRKVEVVVKGVAKAITLAPRIYSAADAPPGSMVVSFSEPTVWAYTSFWLKSVLLGSKLVLVSSDLSHVKVTRRGPATGQERQWVVDCSEASPAPDFWLRDGDKIEVPEKGEGSTATAPAREATPK
jgi:ankyrin repeat protein